MPTKFYKQKIKSLLFEQEETEEEGGEAEEGGETEEEARQTPTTFRWS